MEKFNEEWNALDDIQQQIEDDAKEQLEIDAATVLMVIVIGAVVGCGVGIASLLWQGIGAAYMGGAW